MAAGVLVISAAYAAGRSGSGGPVWSAAYWLGETVLFVPLVWRLLSRLRLGETEAVVLTLSLAIAIYLIKFFYSPAAFVFPDELEHWQATNGLLASHHLFGGNFLLPVSSTYPGLEEVASALVSVTGMPVFVAGLLVAGLAHLLFITALYIVFREVSGSPRVGVIGCAIYVTNPHYQVFDAIYGYQTLGLAFFGLALVAALRVYRLGSTSRGVAHQVRWWVLAVVLIAATVVTHHVTSYALAAALLLFAAVAAATARTRGSISLAVLAGTCVSFIAGWVALVAPSTVGYLTPALHSLKNGLVGILTAHATPGGTATPAGPVADQLAGYAATALIMTGLPFGWWQIWRTQRRDAWALALGLGAAAYYLLALLRVTTPDGAELAGRGLTFVYIPVSYTLAVAIAGPGMALLHRKRRAGRASWAIRAGQAARISLASVAALTLLFGGIAYGWPPYWERLPGRYVVDGFESGITPEGIAAATWARSTLGPGNRIATDYTNYLLMGSYGDQNPVGNLDELYCSPSWTVGDATLARTQAIRYLLVDLRMSQHRSLSGGYFTDRSTACPAPIPKQYLTKFDTVPGFSRVYDSGNIVIYALPGAYHAP